MLDKHTKAHQYSALTHTHTLKVRQRNIQIRKYYNHKIVTIHKPKEKRTNANPIDLFLARLLNLIQKFSSYHFHHFVSFLAPIAIDFIRLHDHSDDDDVAAAASDCLEPRKICTQYSFFSKQQFMMRLAHYIFNTTSNCN